MTQWPRSCTMCLLTLLFRDRLTCGLWAETFFFYLPLWICYPLLHPALCPGKLPHPSFPVFLALGSASKIPWQETGVKKRKTGFPSSQAVVSAVGTSLDSRQCSCLVAPLPWWQSLVPSDLVYLNCRPWYPDNSLQGHHGLWHLTLDWRL